MPGKFDFKFSKEQVAKKRVSSKRTNLTKKNQNTRTRKIKRQITCARNPSKFESKEKNVMKISF